MLLFCCRHFLFIAKNYFITLQFFKNIIDKYILGLFPFQAVGPEPAAVEDEEDEDDLQERLQALRS